MRLSLSTNRILSIDIRALVFAKPFKPWSCDLDTQTHANTGIVCHPTPRSV